MRGVGGQLGFAYVNTGLMYRGVTWALLERGVALADEEAMVRALPALGIEMRLEGKVGLFRIGGIDPEPHVREGRVNDGVSLVAQVGAVRRLLVTQQQALALESALVMEGRDIGTVSFSGTPHNFFWMRTRRCGRSGGASRARRT